MQSMAFGSWVNRRCHNNIGGFHQWHKEDKQSLQSPIQKWEIQMRSPSFWVGFLSKIALPAKNTPILYNIEYIFNVSLFLLSLYFYSVYRMHLFWNEYKH